MKKDLLMPFSILTCQNPFSARAFLALERQCITEEPLASLPTSSLICSSNSTYPSASVRPLSVSVAAMNVQERTSQISKERVVDSTVSGGETSFWDDVGELYSYRWWGEASNGERALGIGASILSAPGVVAIGLGVLVSSVLGMGCSQHRSSLAIPSSIPRWRLVEMPQTGGLNAWTLTVPPSLPFHERSELHGNPSVGDITLVRQTNTASPESFFVEFQHCFNNDEARVATEHYIQEQWSILRYLEANHPPYIIIPWLNTEWSSGAVFIERYNASMRSAGLGESVISTRTLHHLPQAELPAPSSSLSMFQVTTVSYFGAALSYALRHPEVRVRGIMTFEQSEALLRMSPEDSRREYARLSREALSSFSREHPGEHVAVLVRRDFQFCDESQSAGTRPAIRSVWFDYPPVAVQTFSIEQGRHEEIIQDSALPDTCE